MTETTDPYTAIADLIDSTDATIAPAPHPDGGVAPWADDDDGIPADDLAPADASSLPPAIVQLCATEPQNDTGNGQRLLAWFGADVLNVRDIGWHAWADTHWRREGGGEIMTRFAQTTAARIAIEADFLAASISEKKAIDAAADTSDEFERLDSKSDKTDSEKVRLQTLRAIADAGEMAEDALQARKVARRKYAVSSGNAGKIKGMIEQALPHRTAAVGDLDADDLAFNVANGTLRFIAREEHDPDGSEASNFTKRVYRVELRPHAREDRITKVAPVDYDPQAKCPSFDAAILRFQPIEPVRKFLQRYHGYALTALTGEQCLVFNYGTGSNWKSTFVEIVARIMGDYCATIAFDSLAGDQQKSGSQASPDIARLPGARLVRASEPERGVQFREALIKSLTGGESMLTRHNFKDFFEFRPDFKLVLSGNHKPEIGGVDHGIWRRIRFVPWPVTISDHEKRQMEDVLAELWAERAGILNWLIAGTLDYLNGGLRTPQEVIDATAAYRDEMDPVGDFVGMCVQSVPALADGAPQSFVPAWQMFEAFEAWAAANAIRAWKQKSFGTAMLQKGFVRVRHNEGNRYLHVRLKDVPARRRRDDPPPNTGDDDVPV